MRNHQARTCRKRSQQRPLNTQFTQMPRPVQPAAYYSALPQQWQVDSGATHHITPDLSALSIADDYKGTDHLSVASGQGQHISHTGKTLLPTSSTSLHLNNVLCVPQASQNLISVHKLTIDNRCFLEFGHIAFLSRIKSPRQPYSEDRVRMDCTLSGLNIARWRVMVKYSLLITGILDLGILTTEKLALYYGIMAFLTRPLPLAYVLHVNLGS